MLVDADPRRDGSRSSTHLLHVAEGDQAQRAGTSSWIDVELAFGAKVFYKGWLGEDRRLEHHWLSGPYASSRTREALRTGQLEFLDIPTVIERCGGTTEGLHRLQADEVERALRDGFPSVAMTQESSRRDVTDSAEAAEFARQEGGYDTLGEQWPLHVLCQLTTSAESERHVFESLSIHHRRVSDTRWAAVHDNGRWHLSGELDAHVAQRFAGALTGALKNCDRAAPQQPEDLEIDLAGVEFVDVACAQMLVLAGRTLPAGRRIVLHESPRLLRRLLDALERPPSVVLADRTRS